MRIFFFLVVVTGLALGCNNQGGTITDSDSSSVRDTQIQQTPVVIDSTIKGCYSLINKRDTASLELSVKQNVVSGSLSYNIYQKDRNDGTFQGELRGDTIVAWYLFRSEGVMSVRQEIFRVGTDVIWPATGEATVRNDSAFFTNPSQVRFDTSRVFRKVACVI